jgi:hypothetical protein
LSLREKINSAVKDAMKAKESKKRDALRLLTSAFKQIEVDERRELSDEDVMKIIQNKVKKGNESAHQYKEAGREDLMQIELDEIQFYEEYLPKQLNDDELTVAIKKVIEKVGATTMKDMGKVMGVASKELAGLADGKRINQSVKSLLA